MPGKHKPVENNSKGLQRVHSESIINLYKNHEATKEDSL